MIMCFTHICLLYYHCVNSAQVDRHRLTVEALNLLKLIPKGYMPLPHQVGGHRHVDGKLGEYVYMVVWGVRGGRREELGDRERGCEGERREGGRGVRERTGEREGERGAGERGRVEREREREREDRVR